MISWLTSEVAMATNSSSVNITFRFRDLPREMRDRVYELYFEIPNQIEIFSVKAKRPNPNITAVSRQVREETLKLFQAAERRFWANSVFYADCTMNLAVKHENELTISERESLDAYNKRFNELLDHCAHLNKFPIQKAIFQWRDGTRKLHLYVDTKMETPPKAFFSDTITGKIIANSKRAAVEFEMVAFMCRVGFDTEEERSSPWVRVNEPRGVDLAALAETAISLTNYRKDREAFKLLP